MLMIQRQIETGPELVQVSTSQVDHEQTMLACDDGLGLAAGWRSCRRDLEHQHQPHTCMSASATPHGYSKPRLGGSGPLAASASCSRVGGGVCLRRQCL